MIVKMKFLSITGPRTDIDRVTDTYLSKHEIQLENAITELKTVDNLLPFIEMNPYKDALTKSTQFVSLLPDTDVPIDDSPTTDEMLDLIRESNSQYMELQDKKELLIKEQDALKEKLGMLEPFNGLDLNFTEIMNYKYIRPRFGRVSLDYYFKLEKYVYHDIGALFFESTRNANYVYGVYFVAAGEASKVDAALRSLHFEQLELPPGVSGSPHLALQNLEGTIKKKQKEVDEIDAQITDLFVSHAGQLLATRERMEQLVLNFDVRKLAARVEHEKDDYYILCGWMAEKDIEELLAESKGDDKIFINVEDDKEKFFGDPPTKLNNPKLFKPFETFIRMYGLPSHDEMDPTIFVALTYTFIFGVMFGDVGQGLVLFLLGGFFYLWKKISLAGIISFAGIFSTFFGFMFGSFFGFEDVIQPRWLRPIDAMVNVPFIGKLNTVFIVAIAFGMLIIIISMIFHIINAARVKDVENTWFSSNGVAGLVFYGSAITILVLFMTGHSTPGAILLVLMFVVPLILMAFKEPLSKMIEKNTEKMEGGKGMFVVQAFFEMFETLLSYFSNTLSFVRIGAFAISHAAMMQVVLSLAGNETGHINWVVVIIGNLFVCCFEGLIVGIQVLRLEYYEMFSRFYHGSGREFKPYKVDKINKKAK